MVSRVVLGDSGYSGSTFCLLARVGGSKGLRLRSSIGITISSAVCGRCLFFPFFFVGLVSTLRNSLRMSRLSSSAPLSLANYCRSFSRMPRKSFRFILLKFSACIRCISYIEYGSLQLFFSLLFKSTFTLS